MTVIDVIGDDAFQYLTRILANDISLLQKAGRALYTLMLNESAGIIDDIIVYRRSDGYRIVSNAVTRERVLAWLHSKNVENAVIEEKHLAMIAIQGPKAAELFRDINWGPIPSVPFTFVEKDELFVARTGYTGEDGIEVILPESLCPCLYEELISAGASPVGLGARDSLRVEAGFNLYGQDMDENTNPFVSNLGWTVKGLQDKRGFIGKDALINAQLSGPKTKLIGLVLDAKGVIRQGQTVYTGAGIGVVTSGVFSPTLGRSIGLARLPAEAQGDCEIELRGQRLGAQIVKPPFVRRGKRVYK
tara:strand:- start:177 stop:1085 length:909 start_codon:yes stop_codon:yes gene_type:complete